MTVVFVVTHTTENTYGDSSTSVEAVFSREEEAEKLVKSNQASHWGWFSYYKVELDKIPLWLSR